MQDQLLQETLESNRLPQMQVCVSLTSQVECSSEGWITRGSPGSGPSSALAWTHVSCTVNPLNPATCPSPSSLCPLSCFRLQFLPTARILIYCIIVH